MTHLVPVLVVCLSVCFVVALLYRLADRWLTVREAVAGVATKAELSKLAEQVLPRLKVHDQALEALASEFHEEVHKLRAQQVGVLSGMQAARRNYQR